MVQGKAVLQRLELPHALKDEPRNIVFLPGKNQA